MSETLVLSEDDALDVVAFLVTAARTLLDEPVDYGPMRLLSAAHHVCNVAAPRSSTAGRALLEEIGAGIPDGLRQRVRDPAAYRAFLDGLCTTIARGLAVRAGQEAP